MPLHRGEDVRVAQERVRDAVVDGIGMLFEIATAGFREFLILEREDELPGDFFNNSGFFPGLRFAVAAREQPLERSGQFGEEGQIP